MPYWIVRPVIWVLLRIAFALYGGIRFEGREHVPATGGVLITPNHISDADPPTIGVALPRDCWVMAKEELFSIRIMGKLIVWLHGFPVKRYTADRAALRRAEDLLRAGSAVVVFPEGKLSKDGKLQPLLPGVLLIAEHANAPIVPTAIIGTDRLMPYGKTTPRRVREKIIVRFGPPVTVAELKGGGKGGAALRQGAERLGTLMQALQDNVPYPPAPPPPPRRHALRDDDPDAPATQGANDEAEDKQAEDKQEADTDATDREETDRIERIG